MWLRTLPTIVVALTIATLTTAGTLSIGATDGFVDVPDGRLYYEKSGTGPVIVFLHDGLIHREAWDEEFGEFATDHTVIRYDRRGYGRSSTPDKPYSSIADLKAVLDQLKIDSATVVGCSAGSELAVDFALKYPERVTMLILSGATASGIDFTDHWITRGGHKDRTKLATPDGYRKYYVDEDPYDFWSGNQAARARANELLIANPNDLDRSKFTLEQAAERPALPNLKEIKVPVLVLTGEYDMPDMHAHAGAIQSGIPGAQRVVVRSSGHMVHMEQPRTVDSLIRLFFVQAPFAHALATQGAAAVADQFHRIRALRPDAVLFGENQLNRTAYQFLQSGKTGDALILFQLNVEAYPGSANVYDSYGEALLAHGDTAQAIHNYKKSLELNAKNANASEVLKRLGAR